MLGPASLDANARRNASRTRRFARFLATAVPTARDAITAMRVCGSVVRRMRALNAVLRSDLPSARTSAMSPECRNRAARITS